MDGSNWPMRWRMKGLLLVTMDAERRVFEGSIEVDGDRITAIGPALPSPETGIAVIDRRGYVALPGFVQGHIHLCQTLLRGLAEGQRLDRWLRRRIWPLEAAHDPRSLEVSARLGVAETLLHGATTLLDMGTVHHTDVIAAVVEEMGIRAILGKSLMDAGGDVPPRLLQDPEQALAESLELYGRWHNKAGGRIRVAFAPRFTPGVTEQLWSRIAAESRRAGILIHTHVSETAWENETCMCMHGAPPIQALERWGVLDAPAVLVHAIWIDDAQREILRAHGTGIVHCPGSNAKLGSGTADVAALLEAGIPVALGSDSAACNDVLSIPAEMRLAAQLQSLRHGPSSVDPGAPLAMATILGAQALGLADEIGSLEQGKCADLVLFRRDELEWAPDLPVHHSLTFASASPRPREVFVGGRPLVADGMLVGQDLRGIREEATAERSTLLARAEIVE